MRTYENGGLCPKCGNNTNTYRHPFARVWCPSCGYELKEEGDRSPYTWNGEKPATDSTLTRPADSQAKSS